jgi:hypothetical protein
MSTAPNTALWMKELSFEEAPQTLQLRENAAKVMTDNLTTEQIEDLVRLAFGMKPRADCALMTQLIKACQDSDPSFPQFDNDRQLTLIGGMVLDRCMSDVSIDGIGVLCALAVVTASVAAKRDLKLPVNLPALATAALDKATHAGRSRPDLSKAANGITSTPTPTAPKIEAVDAPSIQAAFTELTASVKTYTTKITRQFTAALSSTDRYLQLQDDEMQMLWWLIGERSWQLDCCLSEVSDGIRPLLIAEELAGITRILPGPLSIQSLFARAGVVATEETTLPQQIAAVTADSDQLRKIVPETSFSSLLYPLHFGIERQMENGPGDQWVTAWRNKTGLPDALILRPIDFATQAYRERMLFNAINQGQQ